MKHTHVISCPSPNVPCDVCATPNDTSATQRCHAPKNVKLHLGSVHLPTSTVQGSNKAPCDNIHNYHQLSHDPELPVISSCFSYLKLYIPPVTSLGFPHNFASRALATCWTALKFNAHNQNMTSYDKLTLFIFQETSAKEMEKQKLPHNSTSALLDQASS